LKVIFVKFDNEDDAYLTFETLNTRGKVVRLPGRAYPHELLRRVELPDKHAHEADKPSATALSRACRTLDSGIGCRHDGKRSASWLS
jgi:hypothetical protein